MKIVVVVVTTTSSSLLLLLLLLLLVPCSFWRSCIQYYKIKAFLSKVKPFRAIERQPRDTKRATETLNEIGLLCAFEDIVYEPSSTVTRADHYFATSLLPTNWRATAETPKCPIYCPVLCSVIQRVYRTGTAQRSACTVTTQSER